MKIIISCSLNLMWGVLRHDLMKWHLSLGPTTDESAHLLTFSTESWLNAIYAELFKFTVYSLILLKHESDHPQWESLLVLDFGQYMFQNYSGVGKTISDTVICDKSKATLVESHGRTFIHCSRKYIQDWLTLVIDIFLRESFDCYVQSQATLCPLHLSCQWKCCVALSRTTQPVWQFSRSLTWFFFREATGTVFCHSTAQGPTLLFVLQSRTATHLLRFLEPICSNLW